MENFSKISSNYGSDFFLLCSCMNICLGARQLQAGIPLSAALALWQGTRMHLWVVDECCHPDLHDKWLVSLCLRAGLSSPLHTYKDFFFFSPVTAVPLLTCMLRRPVPG